MVTWTLRIVAAVGLLGSAWVHFALWQEGFAEIAVIGPLFLLNAVAGVLIAVAVLLWRHWLAPLATVGFGAATLLAYLLSLTVGLFGVHEQLTSSAEVWGVITEAACVIAGIALLLRRGAPATAAAHEPKRPSVEHQH